MRPDELKALLRLSPFVPLRLHLTNGLTFDIRHPEMAVVERSIAWIYELAPNLAAPVARKRVFVVLLHITHGEFLGAESSNTGNGATS